MENICQDQDNMNTDLILPSNKKDMILEKKKGQNIKALKFLDQGHMNSKMLCLNTDRKFNQAMDLGPDWLWVQISKIKLI